MDSIFPGIYKRYSEELRAHQSKLMLAEVSGFSQGVLKDTDQVQAYSRDNILMATEFLGEAIKIAFHEAEKWIASNQGAEA